MSTTLPKTEILKIGITNASKEYILEYVFDVLKNTDKKIFIVTPNPEILVYASKEKGFAKILNSAEISLNDGVGNSLAALVLGKPLKERIAGVDFMKILCEKSNAQPITLGFLGSRGKIAEEAAERLKREFSDLQIVLSEAGNPDQKTAKSLIERIDKKNPIDILFVGYGFPRQEQWVYDYLQDLPVRVAMVVGGSFDIFSASLQRAPLFLRAIGLEWLWRLILEPWRWKRQLALVEFVWLVLKEYFSDLLSSRK